MEHGVYCRIIAFHRCKKRWENIRKAFRNATKTLEQAVAESSSWSSHSAISTLYLTQQCSYSANWPNKLSGKAQRHCRNRCTISIQNGFSLNTTANVFIIKMLENKKNVRKRKNMSNLKKNVKTILCCFLCCLLRHNKYIS